MVSRCIIDFFLFVKIFGWFINWDRNQNWGFGLDFSFYIGFGLREDLEKKSLTAFFNTGCME